MNRQIRIACLAVVLVLDCFSVAAQVDPPPSSEVIENVATRDGTVSFRIVRVIETGLDSQRKRFLDWVTGRKPEPLFSRPFGVDWGSSGDLYIADPGQRSVLRIDSRNRVAKANRDWFEEPIGISFCGSFVFVTDSRLGRLSKLDPELETHEPLIDGLDRPSGVACGGHELYLVETGRHRVLVIEGAFVASADGTIALDESNYRLLDRDDLATSSSSELRIRSLGGRGDAEGMFNFPTAIAVSGDRLLVGDTLNFRVQEFSASRGEFKRAFGKNDSAVGSTPRTKGLTLDREGRLWSSDGILDQITIRDAQLDLLGSVGGEGQGPGKFSAPAGISAGSNNQVAIVDSLNRRIQIMRLESEDSIDGR